MVIFFSLLNVAVSYSKIPLCRLLALQTFSWIVERSSEADSAVFVTLPDLQLYLSFVCSSPSFLLYPPVFLITCLCPCPNLSENTDAFSFLTHVKEKRTYPEKNLCEWQVGLCWKCSDVLRLPDIQWAVFLFQNRCQRPSWNKSGCIHWLNASALYKLKKKKSLNLFLQFHAVGCLCIIYLWFLPVCAHHVNWCLTASLS